MAKLHIHPIGLLLMVLGLACWVVALGGLAASTKFCRDRVSEGATYASCGNEYQQDWWAIFFELFLLLVMLFTCFLNAFPKARYVYLTYLIMVSSMLTITTRKFYTKSFKQGWMDNSMDARAFDAAGIGAMFLCMINFALIIFIGLGAAKADEALSGGAFNPLSTQGPATGMGSSSAAQGFSHVNAQGPPTGMGSNGIHMGSMMGGQQHPVPASF